MSSDYQDKAVDQWSQYEQRNKEQEEQTHQKVQEHTESVRQYKEDVDDYYPGRRLLHIFFIFYSFITILTACMLALGQFMVRSCCCLLFMYRLYLFFITCSNFLRTPSTNDIYTMIAGYDSRKI